MRRIMAGVVMVMAFFLVIISGNIFVVYSADPEIVGQHFFQFGIVKVSGDFSTLVRRYKITGVYAVGEDTNYGGTFDLNKHRVVTRFDWFADGQFNPATKATDEKLVLFNKDDGAAAGLFTSTMSAPVKAPHQHGESPCRSMPQTP